MTPVGYIKTITNFYAPARWRANNFMIDTEKLKTIDAEKSYALSDRNIKRTENGIITSTVWQEENATAFCDTG